MKSYPHGCTGQLHTRSMSDRRKNVAVQKALATSLTLKAELFAEVR